MNSITTMVKGVLQLSNDCLGRTVNIGLGMLQYGSEDLDILLDGYFMFVRDWFKVVVLDDIYNADNKYNTQ